MFRHFKRGITLIELAIILLVISILSGGIMVGFEMVRSSETRAILAESERFVAATKAFNDRFVQLPGDFSRAAAMWGTDTSGSGCDDNGFNSVAKRETCSGDGDGAIGSCCPADGEHEWYRVWQHLANSGLMDGLYSGVGGFVTPAQLRVASVPKSIFPGGSWTMRYSVNNGLSAEEFAYAPGTWLFIGQIRAACSGSADPADCIANGPLLTPAQAVDLDSKMDDGVPGGGRIMSRPSTSAINAGCTTTTDALTSRYDITNTQAACSLMIATGF